MSSDGRQHQRMAGAAALPLHMHMASAAGAAGAGGVAAAAASSHVPHAAANANPHASPPCRLCFRTPPPFSAPLQAHPDEDIAEQLAECAHEGGVCDSCRGRWRGDCYDDGEDKSQDYLANSPYRPYEAHDRRCAWCGSGDQWDDAFKCDGCKRRMCVTCLTANFGGSVTAHAHDLHGPINDEAADIPWNCPLCETIPPRKHAALSDVCALGAPRLHQQLDAFSLAAPVRGMTYLTRVHPCASSEGYDKLNRLDPQLPEWTPDDQRPPAIVDFPSEYTLHMLDLQQNPLWQSPASSAQATVPASSAAVDAAAAHSAAACAAAASSSSAAAAAAAAAPSSGPTQRIISVSLYRHVLSMHRHGQTNFHRKYMLGLMLQVAKFPALFPPAEGWRLRIYWDDSLLCICACPSCWLAAHGPTKDQSKGEKYNLPAAWRLLHAHLSQLPFVQLRRYNWPSLQGRSFLTAASASSGLAVFNSASLHQGHVGMLARFLALEELGVTAQMVVLSDLDGIWTTKYKAKLDEMIQRKCIALRPVDPDYKVELWGGASAFAWYPSPDAHKRLAFPGIEVSLHAFASWHCRYPENLRRRFEVSFHYPAQARADELRQLVKVMREELRATKEFSGYESGWSDEQVTRVYKQKEREASPEVAMKEEPAAAAAASVAASASAAAPVKPTAGKHARNKAAKKRRVSGAADAASASAAAAASPIDANADDADDPDYSELFPYASDQMFLSYFVWPSVKQVSLALEREGDVSPVDASYAKRGSAKKTKQLQAKLEHSQPAAAHAPGTSSASSPPRTQPAVSTELRAIYNLYVELPAENKKDMQRKITPLECVDPARYREDGLFKTYLTDLPNFMKGNGEYYISERGIDAYVAKWIEKHPITGWTDSSQARKRKPEPSAAAAVPPPPLLPSRTARTQKLHEAKLAADHAKMLGAQSCSDEHSAARTPPKRAAKQRSAAAAGAPRNMAASSDSDASSDECELLEDFVPSKRPRLSGNTSAAADSAMHLDFDASARASTPPPRPLTAVPSPAAILAAAATRGTCPRGEHKARINPNRMVDSSDAEGDDEEEEEEILPVAPHGRVVQRTASPDMAAESSVHSASPAPPSPKESALTAKAPLLAEPNSSAMVISDDAAAAAAAGVPLLPLITPAAIADATGAVARTEGQGSASSHVGVVGPAQMVDVSPVVLADIDVAVAAAARPHSPPVYLDAASPSSSRAPSPVAMPPAALSRAESAASHPSLSLPSPQVSASTASAPSAARSDDAHVPHAPASSAAAAISPAAAASMPALQFDAMDSESLQLGAAAHDDDDAEHMGASSADAHPGEYASAFSPLAVKAEQSVVPAAPPAAAAAAARDCVDICDDDDDDDEEALHRAAHDAEGVLHADRCASLLNSYGVTVAGDSMEWIYLHNMFCEQDDMRAHWLRRPRHTDKYRLLQASVVQLKAIFTRINAQLRDAMSAEPGSAAAHMQNPLTQARKLHALFHGTKPARRTM